MNGGSRVVGLWPDRKPDADAETGDAFIGSGAEHDFAPDDDAFEAPPRDWLRTIVTVLCLSAGAAWLGFLGWMELPRWLATPPTPLQLAFAIAMASPPLAVLGMIYTLVARGGRAEARGFARTALQLRQENNRLEATLAHLNAQILASRASIAETSDALMSLGEDTVQRMGGVADTMRHEVETIGSHAQALRSSAASARADVAVLLADLPKAHAETRQLAASLETAGISAHEASGKLDAQLASLTARGREADEIAGGAAQKLAAHLARVESVSATAGDRLTEASAQMTHAVDAALDHAARASDAARQGLEAQGAAMLALVDQAQAALQRTGAESADAIATRIGDAHERVEAMAALLGAQSDTNTRLLDALRDGLDQLDARFAKLDEGSEARGERLTSTLAALADHAGALTGSLDRGTGSAEAFIGRTEKLVTALDAATREVDEHLPAALARLDTRAATSQEILARTRPEVAAIESAAGAALDRLIEAEALLDKQRASLDAFASASTERLGALGTTATQVSAEIAAADAAARDLAEGASSQLIDALLRVRETAQVAAERARESIARVIPEAAAGLSEAAREALARTITEQVGQHIGDLTATAEAALATAQNASDRLMRQMLTIADTSAAVEQRITEAKAEVEASDRDNFARRVAMLIESLNSTAIDVTKVLSNDVTDSAWAAYLRGDRGVFTRRAVRLLDAGEAREILRHYEAEPDFRDQVNRYIHDFEAMLRNMLATRDGSALSVTLLSSDMGKLYVALAQAIERLRS